MNLKDEIAIDNKKVFLNLDEFGTEHFIDGKKTLCIYDDESLKTRQGSNELSVSDSSLLIFAETSDLPPQKAHGEKLDIDGKIYVIDDWRNNMGMSEIALHRGESYGG